MFSAHLADSLHTRAWPMSKIQYRYKVAIDMSVAAGILLPLCHSIDKFFFFENVPYCGAQTQAIAI